MYQIYYMVRFLEDGWTLDFVISEIKKNTRRFAKRQLTWNRKGISILWFHFEMGFEGIIKQVQLKMKPKSPLT